jgi:phosphate-selective porin OprO/OprP
MKHSINLIALLLIVALESFASSKTLDVSGQVMLDRTYYQNSLDESVQENNVRKITVGIEGVLSSNLEYEVEYRFNDDNAWRDVYAQYLFTTDQADDQSSWSIKAGNMKEPISLEYISSLKYHTFMERSLLQAFINSRKLGVLITRNSKHSDDENGKHNVHFSIGAFGKSLNDYLDNESSSDTLTARSVYSYKISKHRIVHVGAAFSHANHYGEKLSINSLPESESYERNLISTKVKNVQHTQRMGIESAVIWKSLSFQSELMNLGVHNDDTHYNFQSAYAQLSWMITGESKKYSTKKAAISGIKPKSKVFKGGYGAWELAGRISYLDIDDKDEVESSQKDYTLGINWYWNQNIRWMANYIKATISEPSSSSKTHEEIMQLRLQYTF